MPTILLHVERIALGGLQDPVANATVDGRASIELVEELLRVGGRQRVQLEHRLIGTRTAPTRPTLEELRTGDAQHEHRCIRDEVSKVFEEVKEGGLGPVDVLDDHDERAIPGQFFEDFHVSPRRSCPR